MNRRCIPILVALFFAIGMTATRASAQQPDLRSFLIGKWHQEFGPYVTETVFNANGTYTSITIQPGTPYWVGVEGSWEVRYGNQLWQERWPRGTLLPEGTIIQAIDPDHFQNKLGVVTRVR